MLSGIQTKTPTKILELAVQTGKPGDVDGNGVIETADADMILDYEAQLLEKSLNPMVADVSGDGKIDSNDAVLIYQYLAEQFVKFPVEETADTNVQDE